MIKKTPKIPKKRRKKKALSRPKAFQKFISWLSLPEPLQEPKTQGQLAKQIGVSADTLSDWKKRDDLWEAVEKEWNKWGREKTSNIITRFYNRLLGNESVTADFKLWFQFFLGWQEKVDFTPTGPLLIEHSYIEPKKHKPKGGGKNDKNKSKT